MAKQLLNEAELLLVRQWDQAHLLEKTMERVREKYIAMFKGVVEAVASAYPSLDIRKTFVHQFWGSGTLRFGSTKWRAGDKNAPSGLYMENIRLEKLASEDEPPPIVCIWLSNKMIKTFKMSVPALTDQLHDSAKAIYSVDELDDIELSDTKGQPTLFFKAPSKKEILDLFMAGDEEAFATTLAGYFDAPARLIPKLDTILKK